MGKVDDPPVAIFSPALANLSLPLAKLETLASAGEALPPLVKLRQCYQNFARTRESFAGVRLHWRSFASVSKDFANAGGSSPKLPNLRQFAFATTGETFATVSKLFASTGEHFATTGEALATNGEPFASIGVVFAPTSKAYATCGDLFAPTGKGFASNGDPFATIGEPKPKFSKLVFGTDFAIFGMYFWDVLSCHMVFPSVTYVYGNFHFPWKISIHGRKFSFCENPGQLLHNYSMRYLGVVALAVLLVHTFSMAH
ncbi:hypothetical protein R1flu_008506 [Riccia fluitans]|uniref:Uncharacterized protein n=1 Tax=Riccia fluitans TaxID=41844 RepID=A0ABD1YBV3_9MARC